MDCQGGLVKLQRAVGVDGLHDQGGALPVETGNILEESASQVLENAKAFNAR